MKKTDVVTVPEFAAKIGVTRFTVARWVKEGKIKGSKKGPFRGRTSPILIPLSELERVLKLMGGEEQNNGHSKS